MNNYDTDQRVIELAHYILENNTTIRATAQAFNIPKSTVHHDLKYKLKYISYPMYREVKKLMEANFQIKHIHGGESTKHKYEELKKAVNINDEIEGELTT